MQYFSCSYLWNKLCALRRAAERFAIPFASPVQAAQIRLPAGLLPARNAAHVRQMVGDALVAVDAFSLVNRERWWATEARGDCFVMSMESALWQLLHSSESLDLKRAHSCAASSSR
jgi:hypothetical protein